MLRMGRGPKADQAGNEKNRDQQAQASPPPPQDNFAPYQSAETRYRAVETPQPPKAMTDGEMLARDIKEGTLSGFVGTGTVLTGEATFRGMLRVDGHVTGRVTSEDGTLIIGTGGQVDADIEVAVATINGTVNGDITARQRLELGRAARVNGNVQTPALIVEQGAIFEGSCRMIQLKAALDKQREPGSVETGKLAEQSQAQEPDADTPEPSDTARAVGTSS
ncbi:MAG TPA: polymer-forming cytoskeletal protein [Pyrinomonadaceae bacterium]|jgi:cytoskeletal protein CcmA (bactofilin family)